MRSKIDVNLRERFCKKRALAAAGARCFRNWGLRKRTSIKNGKITAVGGRVLNFVSLCEDLGMARENIKNNVKKLNWSGGFYRKDIGYKVID